ncbi:hypothetical protein, partial [Acinetobacter baumannii]
MVSAVLDIVCGRYRFEIGDGEYLIKLVKKSVVGILMWRTHTAGYGCEERHRYVPNCAEWHGKINFGKLTLRVKFTGRAHNILEFSVP